MSVCLNGSWEYVTDAGERGTCAVPGLVTAPDVMCGVTLFRNITLPPKPFTRLMLELKGARFRPEITVNGETVAFSEGGMCAIRAVFSHRDCVPGANVRIGIRLCGLHEVPREDASRIPDADHWRSNVSSCLWDDVILTPVGDAAVLRMVPFPDADGTRVRVELDAVKPYRLTLRLTDEGRVLSEVTAAGSEREMNLFLPVVLPFWSPDSPRLFRLEAITDDGRHVSRFEIPFGRRDFRAEGKHFRLNGAPFRLRGISVVWHRFLRDPEARELAFDASWFEKNIIVRLRSAGANLLRFHLGVPPERFLDLCDKRGLCVQLEWPFFHGMDASAESLNRQWPEMLALASRHPSVCLIQLWNETEGEALNTARQVLSELRPLFPPFLFAHIDVTHVHKYWWSLFENLNLSFDSEGDFNLPAMADEFGGNYLDGEMQIGGYPEAPEAFERFLGENTTSAERAMLQCLSYGRIAEYWRRIGVAGYAAFCALSSREDGNHLFLGPLKDGRPKETWKALSAAFAPVAASLELWDRAFEPGGSVCASVWLFNDTGKDALLSLRLRTLDENGTAVSEVSMCYTVPAYGCRILPAVFPLPACGTRATVEVITENAPGAVSSWPVRLHRLVPPEALKGRTFETLDTVPGLTQLLEGAGMTQNSENPDLLLGNQSTLTRFQTDADFLGQTESMLESGSSLCLMQIGPQLLGEGYRKASVRMDGTSPVEAEQNWLYRLPFGLRLCFEAVAEAESCCHPPRGQLTFPHLSRGALQLSNGYRGGLNAPAAAMTLEAQGYEGLRAQWEQRGASKDILDCPQSVVYELEGFWHFAFSPSEKEENALRERVRFLVTDAPSLAERIHPEKPIHMLPLGRILTEAKDKALPETALIPLVVCGRGLLRTVCGLISPAGGSGRILLSQLLTEGRLEKSNASDSLYAPRYDPEIAQIVLDAIAAALSAKPVI